MAKRYRNPPIAPPRWRNRNLKGWMLQYVGLTDRSGRRTRPNFQRTPRATRGAGSREGARRHARFHRLMDQVGAGNGRYYTISAHNFDRIFRSGGGVWLTPQVYAIPTTRRALSGRGNQILVQYFSNTWIKDGGEYGGLVRVKTLEYEEYVC